MIWPLLSLERLSLDEREGKVCCRYGKEAKDAERMDDLEFISRATSHIPDKGWAEMIRKVHEVDPMVCPQCGGKMKLIAFLTDFAVVDRIIDHLRLTFVAERPPHRLSSLIRKS